MRGRGTIASLRLVRDAWDPSAFEELIRGHSSRCICPFRPESVPGYVPRSYKAAPWGAAFCRRSL